VHLPKKPEPEAYFSDNLFFRVLRFFNLLEPDRNVLSVSKIMLWMMVVLVWYVLMFMPNQLTAVISVTTGLVGTLMNYAYRRHVQASMPEPISRFPDNFGGTPILPPTLPPTDSPHIPAVDTRPPNVGTPTGIPPRRLPGHPGQIT
jgi:hypothetical protein